jgi:hypothetical protein
MFGGARQGCMLPHATAYWAQMLEKSISDTTEGLQDTQRRLIKNVALNNTKIIVK